MAIFRPSKRSGDVMGSEVGHRPGRMKIREKAISRKFNEESKLCSDPNNPEVKILASKFEEKIRHDLLKHRERTGAK